MANYPASGYRTSTSGNLGDVGTSGYSWSNAPLSATSVYGSRLSFYNSYINPEGYDYRSYAFPVRCVQE